LSASALLDDGELAFRMKLHAAFDSGRKRSMVKKAFLLNPKKRWLKPPFFYAG
jgi:hypothetical protein